LPSHIPASAWRERVASASPRSREKPANHVRAGPSMHSGSAAGIPRTRGALLLSVRKQASPSLGFERVHWTTDESQGPGAQPGG
jgi:hypothetical protein